jgi:hypothetical protein
MQGLKAPSDEVSAPIVKKIWQNVGGADLPVRGKVQERSFARLQTSRSFMHLLSYFFTVFNTHIFPDIHTNYMNRVKFKGLHLKSKTLMLYIHG